MDYSQLTDLLSQVAAQRREIAEARQQIDDLRRAPEQCAKELAHLQSELDTLSRKLARLTPEQEGEYDALQQELAALEAARAELTLLQFGPRHRNAERRRACEKRSKEIRDHRSFTEASVKAREAAERLQELQSGAIAAAEQLEEQVRQAEDNRARHTLACLETIADLPEDDISRLVTEAPQDWADLPMNLLYVLCQPESAPLRSHLTPNQKVLLCARDHIPFPMGKYRWQVVRICSDRALLICMDPVYRKCAFRRSGGDSTWANSDARARLNADFLLDFTEQERAAILPSQETGDKVFCLSEEETKDYLSCSQRAFELNWWLRETLPLDKEFEASNFVYYVSLDGDLQLEYCSSDNIYLPNLSSRYDFSLCYRPAMWVALTPEADDVTWEQLWSTAQDGIVNFWGKWSNPKSKWLRDYGFADPHSINSVRNRPKPAPSRPDYIDYDPLFGHDYHTDV